MTRSLRQTLLIWLLIPMLILFSVGTLFVYQRALSYSEDAYDLSLMESANDIEQLVRTSLNNSGRIDMLRSMKEMQDILLTDQYDKTFFSLLDEQGHLIAGDGKLPLPPTDSKTTGEKKPRLYVTTIGEKPVRALLKKLTITSAGESYSWNILLGETCNKREMLARDILTGFVAPQIIIIFLAILLLIMGIRQGLAPLESLRITVARRPHNDMQPLDVSEVPTEVQPLLQEINRLLARLQAMFETQKRFTADTAHRLRTPLAGLSAQIDLARVQDNPPQTRHALDQIKKVSANLNHAISQLLSLARNDPDAWQSLQMGTLDLTRLARQITMEWIESANTREIDLGFSGDNSPCAITGDAMRIKELLDNLLDNALRYCPSGSKVTVSVASDGTLSVEDNGPGISPEEREHVFERFHRGADIRAEGSGLGLAIVKEIAEIHGGNVNATEGKDGRGMLFSVNFPVANSIPDVRKPLM
ncbi:MAG: ATP-binding protein [Pseudomonadota bacterium]